MSVDRFKLIGTYATPAFRIGDRTRCEVRGELLVCGLHDGPIPWPVGKLSPRAQGAVHHRLRWPGRGGPGGIRASRGPLVRRPASHGLDVAAGPRRRRNHGGDEQAAVRIRFRARPDRGQEQGEPEVI